MEYAAYMRMLVLPCKHKCCYYKLRGPIFATFITIEDQKGMKGLIIYQTKNISETDTCGHGGHARSCKGLDHKRS